MIDIHEESSFAEKSVIGGLILLSDPNDELFCKTMNLLKISTFYKKYHRDIFSAIKILANNNQHIDLLTVEEQCKRQGNNDTSLFVYLAETMRQTPSAANIIAYAKITRDFAIERYTIQKMHSLIAEFTDRTTGDVYQRLGLVESTISEIIGAGMKKETGGLRHISEVAGQWLDEIDERLANNGIDKNKMTTGFESLDESLGDKGIRRGSLVVVGARPKMGKSAFMTSMANHFALDLNEPVALFSMEMPSIEVWERSVTSRANVSPSEFYKRNGMSAECHGRLEMSISEYIKSNYYVDDSVAMTISHIQIQSRKLRKEQGKIGLICVDYLTLMEAPKADRNDLSYGLITKKLKELAKELNCVVVLVTQLNRSLESRADKRPMPSDSRDTGQIEQDCDVWIGIYRESVYDENVFNPALTEIIVRLNRHGKTGTSFAEMKDGYLLPISLEDGQRIKNEQAMDKHEKTSKYKFKRD